MRVCVFYGRSGILNPKRTSYVISAYFSSRPLQQIFDLRGSLSFRLRKKTQTRDACLCFLRKEWDSNPRGREPKRFSRLFTPSEYIAR